MWPNVIEKNLMPEKNENVVSNKDRGRSRGRSTSKVRSYRSDEESIRSSHGSSRRKKHKHKRSYSDYSRSRSRSYSRERKKSKKAKKHKKKKRERSASVDSNKGLTPEELQKKKELEDLTRSARTIFVSSLQVRVTEKDLKKYFKRFCKVKDVILIKDKYSGKSKGFGYVELRSLDDVPKALERNGEKFIWKNGKEGFPVSVKPSEAEKNFTFAQEKRENVASSTYTGQNYGQNMERSYKSKKTREEEEKLKRMLREVWDDKIELKKLSEEADEDEIKKLCSEYGTVIDVHLIRDQYNQRSKGQCFIHFKHSSDARYAARKLDGKKINGKRVAAYMMQRGQISLLKGTSQRDIEKFIGQSLDAGLGLAGTGLQNKTEDSVKYDRDTWRLEADDTYRGQYGGSGIAMNNVQRLNIMSKLGGGVGEDMLEQERKKSEKIFEEKKKNTEFSVNSIQPKGEQKQTIKGVASRFIVARNMFDPAEEEGDWEEEIRADVEEEAAEIGKVVRVIVDKDSVPVGDVYIVMEETQNAISVAHSFNGRYFAGKMINVEFLRQEEFESKFGTIA
eukprot:maker-scaffold_14-snap-gene-11.53-mRNA-1 protein AED:0.00 eAED:0.00 QI:311/1/1/1/1/1/2/39/562